MNYKLPSDIHEILPQQEPFVMVDSLLHFDMTKTVTSFEVKSSCLFVSDGRLSSSGIMENIAQTCAARIGYINKYILKKEIRAGVVGAVRDLEIYRSPHVGDVITTEVEVKEEIFGMILVAVKAYINETLIAAGEMKMSQNQNQNENQNENLKQSKVKGQRSKA